MDDLSSGTGRHAMLLDRDKAEAAGINLAELERYAIPNSLGSPDDESDGAVACNNPTGIVESAFEDIVQALGEMGYDTELDKANLEATPGRAMRAFFDLVSPVSSISKEISYHMSRTFPATRRHGMVLCGPINVFGLCPHHLLPVIMKVHLAYIPDTGGGAQVIGISKLARIAEILARRPVMQEQYAADLADVFYRPRPDIFPEGDDGEDLPDEDESALYADRPDSRAGMSTAVPRISRQDVVNDDDEDDDDGEEVEIFPFPRLKTRGSAVFVDAVHLCMASRGAKRYETTVRTSEVRGAFKHNVETRDEFLQIVSMDGRII